MVVRDQKLIKFLYMREELLLKAEAYLNRYEELRANIYDDMDEEISYLVIRNLATNVDLECFTRVCDFCDKSHNQSADYDMSESAFIKMVEKKAQEYANKLGKTVYVVGQSTYEDGNYHAIDLGDINPIKN